jgi:nickel transport protein
MGRCVASVIASVLALCVLFVAGFAVPALAHKVNVYAYVEDGRIKGEGYFAGGDKAKGCGIEVIDAQGKTVGQATTDDKGGFSLPLPPPAQAAPPLKIVLHAGQGHQGDYTLAAADLGQSQDQGQLAAGEAAFPPRVSAAPPPAQAAPSAPPAGVSAAELEQAVAKVLDQRLAPLTAQVAKLAGERGVSLQDVIGGLGYILGLMGVAAYVKSRQGAGPPKS